MLIPGIKKFSIKKWNKIFFIKLFPLCRFFTRLLIYIKSCHFLSAYRTANLSLKNFKLGFRCWTNEIDSSLIPFRMNFEALSSWDSTLVWLILFLLSENYKTRHSDFPNIEIEYRTFRFSGLTEPNQLQKTLCGLTLHKIEDRVVNQLVETTRNLLQQTSLVVSNNLLPLKKRLFMVDFQLWPKTLKPMTQ